MLNNNYTFGEQQSINLNDGLDITTAVLDIDATQPKVNKCGFPRLTN